MINQSQFEETMEIDRKTAFSPSPMVQRDNVLSLKGLPSMPQERNGIPINCKTKSYNQSPITGTTRNTTPKIYGIRQLSSRMLRKATKRTNRAYKYTIFSNSAHEKTHEDLS